MDPCFRSSQGSGLFCWPLLQALDTRTCPEPRSPGWIQEVDPPEGSTIYTIFNRSLGDMGLYKTKALLGYPWGSTIYTVGASESASRVLLSVAFRKSGKVSWKFATRCRSRCQDLRVIDSKYGLELGPLPASSFCGWGLKSRPLFQDSM